MCYRRIVGCAKIALPEMKIPFVGGNKAKAGIVLAHIQGLNLNNPTIASAHRFADCADGGEK